MNRIFRDCIKLYQLPLILVLQFTINDGISRTVTVDDAAKVAVRFLEKNQNEAVNKEILTEVEVVDPETGTTHIEYRPAS